MSDQDWPLRAACRTAPLEAPFAAKNSPELRLFITSYCDRGPVRRQCLASALAAEETLSPGIERHGVFGGLTGKERAALVKRGTRACKGCRRVFVPANSRHARCHSCSRVGVTYTPGPVREHGKPAGYEQHLRRGEEPCAACRAAKNAYDRARRSVRGAA